MRLYLKFNVLLKSKKVKVVLIIILILALSSIWQNKMVSYESIGNRYPGELINVNGHDMHVFRKGQGSSSVVFTVGSGTPSAYTDYYFIQQEISKVARTISYDRAGYGWSEATSIPRTVDEQINDLHQLLNSIGEKPPYILVGHSLSSLEVMRFAQVFPEEVAGIVLIDGGNPRYYAEYNEPMALAFSYFLEGVRKCGIMRALGSAGIMTPIVGENIRYKKLPKDIAEVDKKLLYKNLGNPINRNEIANMNDNANKVIAEGKLGDIPLIILTSGTYSKWESSQRELKNWSNNSKQEVVEGAGHYIHWDNPEVVIDRIKELLVNNH